MCPGTAVGRLEVDIPVKHKVFLVTYFYYVREVAAMFEEMRHYIFESSEKINLFSMVDYQQHVQNIFL
jgi:hypothetical protein